ncbi:hypothetical protein SCLCIDRAFT_303801 [Scleroderma citrinum Foug A]|uniref:Uncharacterized protein n=1 Tax=Scleroderma citrinum Foug A TaxID=1036808 RepID=A0A0C2ZRY9_9AGAM|nr:hypothetical protein SCLCIDRAFT_303801 [Scleroderma citrinum Foug A]
MATSLNASTARLSNRRCYSVVTNVAREVEMSDAWMGSCIEWVVGPEDACECNECGQVRRRGGEKPAGWSTSTTTATTTTMWTLTPPLASTAASKRSTTPLRAIPTTTETATTTSDVPTGRGQQLPTDDDSAGASVTTDTITHNLLCRRTFLFCFINKFVVILFH